MYKSLNMPYAELSSRIVLSPQEEEILKGLMMLCVDHKVLLGFSWKRRDDDSKALIRQNDDPDIIMAEQILIQNDLDYPNMLRDNILYYVSGFIVRSLLSQMHCDNCKSELLLDPTDSHAANAYLYPLFARFAASKQKGGLIFPSLSVLKIVKATEVVFCRRVIDQGIGISAEKNCGLKIQNAVLECIDNALFNTLQKH